MRPEIDLDVSVSTADVREYAMAVIGGYTGVVPERSDPIQFYRNQAAELGVGQPFVPGTLWACLLLATLHRLGYSPPFRVSLRHWTVPNAEYRLVVDASRGTAELRSALGVTVVRARWSGTRR